MRTTFFKHLLFVFTFSILGFSDLTAQGGDPVPVNTAKVVEGAFAQPIRLTGTVDPFESTTLASELDGIVRFIMTDEGDYVTTNSVLMSLRRLPFELELKRAEANAQENTEILREYKAGTRPEDIDIAKANWDEAIATAKIVEDELKRQERLLSDRSISQSGYDIIRSNSETAKAKERVAKAIYDRVVVGKRLESIAAQEAITASSLALVDLAKDNLDRSSVKAPYSGVITKRYISPGSWIGQGDPVFDLVDLDQVKVSIQIPERYFSKMKLGDHLEVTFDALPQETFTGMIYQIIPQADERSRAFPVRVAIANKDQRLAIGMLARVVIDISNPDEQSTIIPKDALVPHRPDPIVYRVEMTDGKATAEMVTVKTGRFFGEAVEVFGDLKAGDQVVIRGNERLVPGAELKLNTFIANRSAVGITDPSRFFDESNRK